MAPPGMAQVPPRWQCSDRSARKNAMSSPSVWRSRTPAAPKRPHRALPVEEEHPKGYSGTHFGFWTDTDGDGCNTGKEVMIQQAADAVVRSPGCRITSGKWLSPYDDVTVSSPSEISIDFVVALSEAW